MIGIFLSILSNTYSKLMECTNKNFPKEGRDEIKWELQRKDNKLQIKYSERKHSLES